VRAHLAGHLGFGPEDALGQRPLLGPPAWRLAVTLDGQPGLLEQRAVVGGRAGEQRVPLE
jgi:hypothetical protein